MSLVFIDSLSISGMEGGLAGETGVGEKVQLRAIRSQCLRGKEEGRRMDYSTNRQKVGQNCMTEIKVEYNGRTDPQALSRVEVLKAKVHGQWGVDQSSVIVKGWEAQCVVSTCRGHPTVLVFNNSDKPVWIHKGEIEVKVTPLQEVITYSLVTEKEEEAWREAEEHFNTVGPPPPVDPQRQLTEAEVAHIPRPAEFPEKLWPYVNPNDRAGVEAQFAAFPIEVLRKSILHLMYDTSIYADGRKVTTGLGSGSSGLEIFRPLRQ